MHEAHVVTNILYPFLKALSYMHDQVEFAGEMVVWYLSIQHAKLVWLSLILQLMGTSMLVKTRYDDLGPSPAGHSSPGHQAGEHSSWRGWHDQVCEGE